MSAVRAAMRISEGLAGAEPGQIVVANVVRELCARKGLTFGPVALAELKGFDGPVALCRVVLVPQE